MNRKFTFKTRGPWDLMVAVILHELQWRSYIVALKASAYKDFN